jgi:ABC-2 type transport system ATP-binding protein
VVLSTHNLDEVERLADRVAVLRRRLLALDTPAALRQRLFGSRLRIVLAQPAAPLAAGLGLHGVSVDGSTLSVDLAAAGITTPDLVRRLAAAGADVLVVAPEEPPLEDVYLRRIHQGAAS